MAKVTFKTKAWMGKYNVYAPNELATEKGADSLMYSNGDMSRFGDSYVGEATITVDIPDVRTLVDNKIAALREEAKTVRAEASAKCTTIEGQIQQLLCIENSPSAAA